MKVKKLIEELQRFSPNKTVYTFSDNGQLGDVFSVEGKEHAHEYFDEGEGGDYVKKLKAGHPVLQVGN